MLDEQEYSTLETLVTAIWHGRHGTIKRAAHQMATHMSPDQAERFKHLLAHLHHEDLASRVHPV